MTSFSHRIISCPVVVVILDLFMFDRKITYFVKNNPTIQPSDVANHISLLALAAMFTISLSPISQTLLRFHQRIIPIVSFHLAQYFQRY